MYRFLLFFSLLPYFLSAQTINPALQKDPWAAHWIAAPDVQAGELNVTHYRRAFSLTIVPGEFIIHISADMRYKLYLNGTYLGQGPANNDLYHYTFDTYDLAAHLRTGENLLAVEVIDFGRAAALRFHSNGTALIVQGDGEAEQIVNTSEENWRSYRNPAYTPLRPYRDFSVRGYYAVGTAEQLDAGKYPWGWRNPGFDDTDWEMPRDLGPAYPRGYPFNFGDKIRELSPRPIPMMHEAPEQPLQIRRVEGIVMGDVDGPGVAGLTIPARSKVSLLLDQGYLTKGFPVLLTRRGAGATISLQYAEALYDTDGQKGNRNEIQGKEIIGNKDIFLPDGEEDRRFTTLWYRTWRYIKVEVETGDEPLRIEGLSATRFWYPFEETAYFDTGEDLHRDIWEVGWRTALLCSDETYMDCPYYEQLQYVGDTRIQTFISLYVSGDDRLMRNAINQFYHSITNEGITQSRYPSRQAQMIPTYALFWINMIHDYHLLRNDDTYTRQFLTGIGSVLDWYERRLDESGLLGPLDWWQYMDWVPEFRAGVPPGVVEGGSLPISLQFVYALQEAEALFRYHGKEARARHCRELADRIRAAANRLAFDADRGLYADTPEKQSYSQHGNILAILTNTLPAAEQSDLFQRIVSDTTITDCNIYFRFYLTRAAQQTGNGDYFIQNMDFWENMLAEGLSTFAERAGNTRSDCHAWSASPNYEYLATVAGIQPVAPHFEKVHIAPHPGDLEQIRAGMPHPAGEIAVDLSFREGQVEGTVTLPPSVTGTFVWRGKELILEAGENVLRF